MTMVDDPDEDADNLDDDALFESYLQGKSGMPREGLADPTDTIPDWPPATMRDVGLTLDHETVAWFRASHSDWRREMSFVLRAWVAAQTAEAGTVTEVARREVLADLKQSR